MRKFSKIILSSIVLSAPFFMAACSDDNNTGDGDGDGDGGGTSTSSTSNSSGDGDTTTSSSTTATGDGDSGDGDTGIGGNGGESGTTDDSTTSSQSDCEYADLFCIEDCAATDGPNDMVKDSKTGAFVDSATWMDGWTNWSTNSDGAGVPADEPEGSSSCTFDDDTCTWISEDIADDLTLSADKIYGIRNAVHVLDGVTLTIEPGTVIKGDSITKGTLVVSRGGKLMAEGTAAKPIVFTSNKGNGDKAKGQWGGVIMLGKASNWKGGNVQVEGLVDDPLNQYGADAVTDGSTDDDNSGSLKYVRIEFGGIELSTDKEINGLTLGSIGSKTKISYVQVNTTLDDGIEWFGGTVSADHLVVNNAGDDMYDIDQGYRGTIDTIFGRQVVPSTSDPNGFEWDSDKSGGDDGVGLTPATDVTLKNGTMCGTGKLGKPNYGMVLRENITGTIDNLAFMGFDAGVDARDNFLVGSSDEAKVEITNSTSWYHIDGIASPESGADDDDFGFDEAAWFEDESSNTNLD